MELLNRLKISQKLFLIAVLVVFSLLTMAATFYYVQGLLSEHSDIRKRAELMHYSVNQIEVDVLEARRREKDFLLRFDMQYIDSHDDAMYSLEGELVRLRLLSSDDPTLLEIIQTVRDKLDIYTLTFTKVVESHVKIGLDYEKGLLGDLRASVHSVEELLETQNELELLNSKLTMRRHEKDFIARENQQYLIKLEQELQHFRSLLRQSNLSSASKNNINSLISDYHQRFLALAEETMRVKVLTQEFRAAVHAVEPQLQGLKDHVSALALAEEKYLSKHITTTTFIYYGMTLSLIILVVSLLYLLSRNINLSMLRVSSRLQEFATGDAMISDRLDVIGKDEMTDIAMWFNQLMDKLQIMLKEISELATHLTDTANSSQVAKNETTKEITFQVQEIGKIATSIDSITTSIDQVADNASEASNKANEADSAARKGNQEVGEVMASIQQLSVNIEQAVSSVKQIDDYSKSIDSIVAMINGIAEQTNLLALNAAIEAARAGEAGRGFAVVADEVRTLSQRTTASTEEIKETIISLQKGTSHAVEVMGESQDQAVKSVAQAKQAGDSINDITDHVSSIAILNSRMSESASKQSVSAQQINQTIVKINIASTKLADSAKDSMSDSGDVSQTATLLLMMSKQFGSSDKDIAERKSGSADSGEDMDIALF